MKLQAELIDTLVANAKKNHNANGNPVYRIEVQPILDAGISLVELKKKCKDFGCRLVEKDSKISISSYALRTELAELLA